MNRRIALTGMLLTALASASAAQTRVIAGTVQLAGSRLPVAGARVAIGGMDAFAYSDSLGRFIIRGLGNPPLRVEVSRAGVVAFDTLVAANDDVMVALFLDPGAMARADSLAAERARQATLPVRVRGTRGGAIRYDSNNLRVIRVLARDGCSHAALHGVLVHALGTDLSAFTDTAGVFTLKEPSRGAYYFGVRQIGYRPASASVPAGGDTTVTVLLSSERAPTAPCRSEASAQTGQPAVSPAKNSASATARTRARPTTTRAH